MSDGTTAISFAYDADGLRTSKTVNGLKHSYLYASGKLLRETYGSNTLDFFYDANGMPYALKYNGTVYYYITNLQGDVMQLVNANGNIVASYDYDPYGKVISATGTMAEINPLRYRGYYYDVESGLYYLQSRYYNPEIGRFINADSFVSTGQSFIGYEMFAYCSNNPVNHSDAAGQYPCSILDRFSDIVDGALHAFNDVAVSVGIDTAGIGASILDMYGSSDGIYHASADCWQQYFGYNDLYDFAFDIGTSMEAAKFQFSHDGTEYIIWAWKGDYINLGAGAEIGIYYGGGPQWFVDTGLSIPMSLSLSHNGSNIISHSATTWWMTGFNSNCLNVESSSLTASFTLDFSGNTAMYSSLYGSLYGTPGWTFDKCGYTATFSF